MLKKICRSLLVIVCTHQALAADAGTMLFDGSRFIQAESKQSGAEGTLKFVNLEDADFLETISIHRFSTDATFDQQLRLQILNIRNWHPGVRLKILRQGRADDVIIAFLAELKGGKAQYSAIRIARHLGGVLSATYQVDIELGLTDNDQERRIRNGAIDALAKLDLGAY